jgi:hypothetical protein
MYAASEIRARFVLVTLLVIAGSCPASMAQDPEAAAAAAAAAPRVERTYDINDLLWGTAPSGSPDPDERTRPEAVKEIVTLLMETVDPDTWKPHGGRDTIVERDARLVVSASAENHRQIANLFDQFRETADLQGTTLGLQFLVADEAFLRAHVPAAVGDKPQAMTIGALTARQVAQAVRFTPGVLSMSAPPTPLFHRTSSFALGPPRSLKLPDLDGPAGRVAEVRVPGDVTVGVRGADCRGYVALDLDVRAATFDPRPAGGGGDDEIAAGYRGTITVEQGGRFLLSAPLVRSRLTGVRDAVGPDGVARQEVVREPAPAAEQSDPRRFLLVLGAVRGMTDDEITEIAGSEVVRHIRERYGAPDPVPPPPGEAPAPPPPPPPPPALGRVNTVTRVYDVSALLLGSEPEAERAAARKKRLERVIKEVQAVLPPKTPLRDVSSRLILITAPEATLTPVAAVIDRMLADQVLPRK